MWMAHPMRAALLVTCLSWLGSNVDSEVISDNSVPLDVLIIGAGPGGLQWATLLHGTHLKYTVLERASRAGAFFKHYPRQRRMISHNKCLPEHFHEDFRLRHDWHSLLDADVEEKAPSPTRGLRLCDFTREYYAKTDDVVDYFVKRSEHLNIKYNASVVSIEYASDTVSAHKVHTQNGQIWFTHHVVIATGLEALSMPTTLRDKINLESGSHPPTIYDYGSMPNMKGPVEPWCEYKHAMVVGVGNAGFEIANMIMSCVRTVDIVGRSPPKMAALTHYPGHVRLQNLGIMDRFFLKTLDSYIPGITISNGAAELDETALSKYLWGADFIVFCGGFSSRRERLVEDMDMRTKYKYPHTGTFYAIRNQTNAWYAGALMHGRDFMLSAGGFIHGFRYLVRAQARYVMQRDYGIRWPISTFSGFRAVKDLIAHAAKRFQTSSGLYQMQQVLSDLILYSKDRNEYIYVPEVPKEWSDELATLLFSRRGEAAPEAYCQLYFSYANGSTHFDFDSHSKLSIFGGEIVSNKHPPFFLHPVYAAFTRNQDTGLMEQRNDFHVHEDLETRWENIEFVAQMHKGMVNPCLNYLHPPACKSNVWVGPLGGVAQIPEIACNHNDSSNETSLTFLTAVY